MYVLKCRIGFACARKASQKMYLLLTLEDQAASATQNILIPTYAPCAVLCYYSYLFRTGIWNTAFRLRCDFCTRDGEQFGCV